MNLEQGGMKMIKKDRLFGLFVVLFLITAVTGSSHAQKKKAISLKGKPVLWERVDISKRNLLLGPGGAAMKPNVRNVRLIRKETGGNNLKYRIRDARGRIWVAKIADESQPEVAANRLMWAIGYSTEIDYLVPSLRIPGKKTYEFVRLEARPAGIKRQGNWKWDDNPFAGSNEFHGLLLMMALLNNWDLKDSNNVILQDGHKLRYAVSDLGSSFGKLAISSKFLLNRIGRSVNDPEGFSNSAFIKGVQDGEIEFAYKGKRVGLMENITTQHGRWLADLLLELNDVQIRDAFRAANYSEPEIDILAGAVKNRISEIDRATRPTVAENE